MSILDEIIQHKRKSLPAAQSDLSDLKLTQIKDSLPPRFGFTNKLDHYSPAVIAEIKRASPSKGLIRPDFDPVQIAHSYIQQNAACLSVLTDSKYFQGSKTHLEDVRQTTQIPILRKDFIIDGSQLIESLQIGADCILLIVAALTQTELISLNRMARLLGLDVLIEVHTKRELDSALECDPDLIGINNRNLETFDTSLTTTFSLLNDIPAHVRVVSESGIHTQSQIAELRAAGVETFLVGEAFMRQADPGQALTDLFGTIDCLTG